MKIFFLIIIIISLAGNAFALSGKRKNIERQTCYTASVNDGESKGFAKAYCSCVANKLDEKYTDKQLDALVNKGNNFMINELRPLAKKCFNKVS